MLIEATLVGTAVVMTVVLMIVKGRSKKQRTPPGPSGPPYFGQAFRLSANSTHLTFTAWAKRYGDISMFHMFGRNIVILSNPDDIRQAFADPEFSVHMSNRPPSFVGHFCYSLYKTLLFREYDELCRKLKAVTAHALHCIDERSGNYRLLVKTELNDYIREIASSGGDNIDIVKPIETSLCKLIGVMSAIGDLIYHNYATSVAPDRTFTGRLLQNGDPILQAIQAMDRHGNEIITPSTHIILKVMPFLRYLPGYYGNLYRTVMSDKENLRKVLLCGLKERYAQGDRAECLLNSLFAKQETEDWFTDDFILGVVMDLINTSTMTSRGVLSGFFFLLVHFQDVQAKIQEEVDSVIGPDRQPEPEDMVNMPYTHACILEVLRYQSHLGITATHTASTEMTFAGFTIPKGSSIYGVQWRVHHDEKYWPQPWDFRPERFLQADGTLLPRDHETRSRYFMPFGVGNRSCIGNTMAYTRMFLYITMVLQRHKLLTPVGQSLPSHDPRHLTPGTVLQAPNFTCRVVPR